MKRFLILTKSLALIQLRNGAVLFWNFAFPVLLMLIYGVVMSQYMKYMTPGVIVLNALSFGLVGSSTMMLELREKSILRRLQATTLPAWQLITSYLLVNIVIGTIQSTLILIVGAVFYEVPVSATSLLLVYPKNHVVFLPSGPPAGIVNGIAPTAGTSTAV